MAKNYLPFVLLVLAAAGALYLLVPSDASTPEIEALARCLREKGIVMYGADWCPHCQNEKLAFGDSFRFVPYVECPQDPNRCLAAGIKGYPTWIFADGKKLEGEQGLQKLSVESGCSLPMSK